MLVFDQLKKNDPTLRLLALMVFAGFSVLLAGLWWVQIVKAREYQANLETQSFRTVRIPAMRGKILDRNGSALADNRPNYNVSLYLEEFSQPFRKEIRRSRPTRVVTNDLPFWKEWLGVPTVKTQIVRLNDDQALQLNRQSRYRVANGVVRQVAGVLQTPIALDYTNFYRHYETRRALPYPVARNVDFVQLARFEEFPTKPAGTDVEIQATRVYPNGTTAAHLLGHLHYDDSSKEGEDASFSYRLPDFRGLVGIEAGFDRELRGRAGAKSVLVNSGGFRQNENIWDAAEPGRNVVLTLDLRLQQAAEQALRGHLGALARAAVVVMDVRNGDVLALVSSPSFDPNDYIKGLTPEENRRLNDPILRPQINRATQENYPPGSIFKPLVGLACLENGLDHNESIYNPGYIRINRRAKPIDDLAQAGNYNFHRAMLKSCNTYFITNGLRYGMQNIAALARQFHFGERSDLPTRQETAGIFPTSRQLTFGWSDGDTANICIGQGKIAVTPLQMAVMTSALANGGKVFWPRLVDRLESQDPLSTEPPAVFERGRVRDRIAVQPHNLRILREAMLADTEDPEATAYEAFHENDRRTPRLKSLRVCGKTGTAQVQNVKGETIDHITWFISFAPYESARYAVVVMVESGGSGGGTCAPVARDIYTAIQRLEAHGPGTTVAQAK